MSADDCTATFGQNPCGAWSCTAEGRCAVVAAECSDADRDGYGVGAGCGCLLDCDDDEPAIGDASTRECCREGTMTCAAGVWTECVGGHEPSAESCDGEDDDCNGKVDDGLGTFTCGMGACRTTVAACEGGELDACVPLTPTATSDACNGEDDDCDGAVDEDCPSCVHVAPDGDDAEALASGGATPFRTIQSGIDFAASSLSTPKNVCVAVGPACGGSATYLGPTVADLTMRNGVSLLGGYESTGWTRCTGGTTRITLGTGLGVLFPPAIDSETVLDGFVLDRAATATTAGVTVDGAREVMLSNLRVRGGPVATNSYGINVVNGGQATLFRSTVDGGQGFTSIGVRAVGSRVALEANCAPDAMRPDRCTGCSNASSGIRGAAAGDIDFDSYAVLLDSSPGSRVEDSSICTNTDSGYEEAGVRIRGQASGVVVRGNAISATSYRSTGVSMESCEGGDPWIVNNSVLAFSHGVQVAGDCRPVIDSNSLSSIATDTFGTGVLCEALGNVPSRCVISRNSASTSLAPQPAVTFVGSGYGVICRDGSCPRVSRNTLVGLSAGSGTSSPCGACLFTAVGLLVTGAQDMLIDRNRVSAGCSSGSATGMSLSGVSARVQNNVVNGYGGLCQGTRFRVINFAGIRILVAEGQGEFDVHSNTIDGGDDLSSTSIPVGESCKSAGVAYEVTSATAFRGVFRGNSMLSGPCHGVLGDSRFEAYAFRGGDPRIFQHNALFAADDPGDHPLYLSGTPLTIDAVNQLTTTISSGNIESTCSPTSVPSCSNAGTPVGAPRRDFDGKLRDAMPDIGAYER